MVSRDPDDEDSPDSSAGHVDRGEGIERRRLRSAIRGRLFGKTSNAVMIGPFRVERKLGEGAAGRVYAAVDTRNGETVALKVLRSTDQVSQERIQREARALQRLAHPHVVAAREVGPFEDGMYLAMDLVPGTTLRDWLRADPAPDRIVGLFLPLADALAAAHDLALVHRDVKPDNVLVDGHDHPYLLDFGLARSAAGAVDPMTGFAGKLTRTGAMLGTIGYMAPEQLMGRDVDDRTDQFAFCVTMYEALFRRRPFPGDDLESIALATVRGELRVPPARAGVPDHVRSTVLRGLASDPGARHRDMRTLAGQLLAPDAGPDATRILADLIRGRRDRQPR